MLHAADTLDDYLTPPDVHEAMRARASGVGLALLLALVLTLAHGLNVYFFLYAGENPVAGLLVHLLLVAVTAIVARAAIVRNADGRMLVLLLVATAFFGVFGAAGTALAAMLYFLHSYRAQTFDEWFSSIFPLQMVSEAEQTYADIQTGRDESAKDYSIIPFMDVMEVGSETQKREALSKMTMRFHSAFAPVFHRALRDESNTVRVQAGTAVARIEGLFLKRLLRLAEVHRLHPEDPRVVLALARHCDDYAFTGLLDPEREQANRQEALTHYRAYLRLRPNDEAARVQMGRLLLRNGESHAAADFLSDAVQQGGKGQDLLRWYAEALYLSGRYEDLRALVAAHPDLGEAVRPVHPELAESLRLWAGSAA